MFPFALPVTPAIGLKPKADRLMPPKNRSCSERIKGSTIIILIITCSTALTAAVSKSAKPWPADFVPVVISVRLAARDLQRHAALRPHPAGLDVEDAAALHEHAGSALFDAHLDILRIGLRRHRGPPVDMLTSGTRAPARARARDLRPAGSASAASA